MIVPVIEGAERSWSLTGTVLAARDDERGAHELLDLAQVASVNVDRNHANIDSDGCAVLRMEVRIAGQSSLYLIEVVDRSEESTLERAWTEATVLFDALRAALEEHRLTP